MCIILYTHSKPVSMVTSSISLSYTVQWNLLSESNLQFPKFFSISDCFSHDCKSLQWNQNSGLSISIIVSLLNQFQSYQSSNCIDYNSNIVLTQCNHLASQWKIKQPVIVNKKKLTGKKYFLHLACFKPLRISRWRHS